MHNKRGPFLRFKIFHEEKKCNFCKKQIETTKHIFLLCGVTQILYNKYIIKTSNRLRRLYLEEIYYGIGLSEIEAKKISIFKLTLWRMRSMVMLGGEVSPDPEKFGSLFNSNITKFG